MAIIPHPRDIQVAVVDWFDARFPLTRAVDEALYQRVPNFANAFYYCFGEYDGVVIFEAPDEATATATIITAIAPGHLKATEKTVSITVEDTAEAMH